MKIKGLRWYIAFLLCLASALNYLDRQTLSVLIGTIKEELHLTNASYGAINAWFLASYGVMYAVSGRIIDYIGTRRGFMVFVSGWSVANMLHVPGRDASASSPSSGSCSGVFEPGSFTGGVKAVREWFPMRDRALAIGIFNAGTAIGSSPRHRSCPSSPCIGAGKRRSWSRAPSASSGWCPGCCSSNSPRTTRSCPTKNAS